MFASPVAGYLLRYGADMGFRGLLLEPDEARAAGAAALGFPLLTAIPDDLDDSADVVVTDHHRPELGVMLRDALATKARWVGIMGKPHIVGPHVAMLTELGVPAERSPACTGRSGSTSAPGSRRRSPSRPWPACSPTATAAPADSNSDPEESSRRGIPARFARLHRIASHSIRRRLDPASAVRALCGTSG